MPNYGRHLHTIPMPTAKLTGELLCKRLRAMSPSSMGLDGWGLQNGRSLPDRALVRLAQLLQLVEDTGQWPRVVAEGTSLIPQLGEEGPGRPPVDGRVHCLPAVGRPWLRDVLLWQEGWVHAEGYCFRVLGSHRRGRGHGRPARAGAAKGVEFGRLEPRLCQMI